MKNIKTSILTLAFLSVSGFAALSMDPKDDKISENITIIRQEKIISKYPNTEQIYKIVGLWEEKVSLGVNNVVSKDDYEWAKFFTDSYIKENGKSLGTEFKIIANKERPEECFIKSNWGEESYLSVKLVEKGSYQWAFFGDDIYNKKKYGNSFILIPNHEIKGEFFIKSDWGVESYLSIDGKLNKGEVSAFFGTEKYINSNKKYKKISFSFEDRF